ncbi:hypothetical protein SNEBB_006965 [Seison nebaliae]|nr:hypothetical protein SNEBB_006965 [Seison nebaliae]
MGHLYSRLFAREVKQLKEGKRKIIPKPLHEKARSSPYTRTKLERFEVEDKYVPWEVLFPKYEPIEFTSPKFVGPKRRPYADPDFPNEQVNHPARWNEIDASYGLNRKSHEGTYKIVDDVPLNPRGRTGLCGRGHLGFWGPNHATDPIVSRWKMNKETNEIESGRDRKPIMQLILIRRRDTNMLAIPGGMVSKNELETVTRKREFAEEAMNSLELSEKEKVQVNEQIEDFFSRCFRQEIYAGYVDDPRNTDNAWMETIATHYHDNNGEHVEKFKLKAGDDAVGVEWYDYNSNMNLYANHGDWINQVATNLSASKDN